MKIVFFIIYSAIVFFAGFSIAKGWLQEWLAWFWYKIKDKK